MRFFATLAVVLPLVLLSAASPVPDRITEEPTDASGDDVKRRDFAVDMPFPRAEDASQLQTRSPMLGAVGRGLSTLGFKAKTQYGWLTSKATPGLTKSAYFSNAKNAKIDADALKLQTSYLKKQRAQRNAYLDAQIAALRPKFLEIRNQLLFQRSLPSRSQSGSAIWHAQTEQTSNLSPRRRPRIQVLRTRSNNVLSSTESVSILQRRGNKCSSANPLEACLPKLKKRPLHMAQAGDGHVSLSEQDKFSTPRTSFESTSSVSGEHANTKETELLRPHPRRDSALPSPQREPKRVTWNPEIRYIPTTSQQDVSKRVTFHDKVQYIPRAKDHLDSTPNHGAPSKSWTSSWFGPGNRKTEQASHLASETDPSTSSTANHGVTASSSHRTNAPQLQLESEMSPQRLVRLDVLQSHEANDSSEIARAVESHLKRKMPHWILRRSVTSERTHRGLVTHAHLARRSRAPTEEIEAALNSWLPKVKQEPASAPRAVHLPQSEHASKVTTSTMVSANRLRPWQRRKHKILLEHKFNEPMKVTYTLKDAEGQKIHGHSEGVIESGKPADGRTFEHFERRSVQHVRRRLLLEAARHAATLHRRSASLWWPIMLPMRRSADRKFERKQLAARGFADKARSAWSSVSDWASQEWDKTQVYNAYNAHAGGPFAWAIRETRRPVDFAEGMAMLKGTADSNSKEGAATRDLESGLAPSGREIRKIQRALTIPERSSLAPPHAWPHPSPSSSSSVSTPSPQSILRDKGKGPMEIEMKPPKPPKEMRRVFSEGSSSSAQSSPIKPITADNFPVTVDHGLARTRPAHSESKETPDRAPMVTGSRSLTKRCLSGEAVGECISHVHQATKETLHNVREKAKEWLSRASSAVRDHVQEASLAYQAHTGDYWAALGNRIRSTSGVIDHIYEGDSHPFAIQRLTRVFFVGDQRLGREASDMDRNFELMAVQRHG
ncbi:hypothetical protein CBOM_00657 [Ceraceosorus bombacis]|uniref:Uncharacterized protein n=1 Tax=Ceraceosorus bombacis TaxID=401625 RepID=A0A0P1BAE5_9BASI|nr:hypothetical protein CBOM_00657 [Ceraceosorus bombacis]